VGVKSETLTVADVRASIGLGRLSEEEERYVRMRFGISEPRTAQLARRGAEFPETRARLALMEASLVADRLPTTGNPVKDRIIDRLRKL
jgi:hypothetical protein